MAKQSITARSHALLVGVSMGLSLLLFGCRPQSVNTDVVLRPAYGSLEELFQTEIVGIGLEKLGYEVVSGSEVEYDVIHEAIANGYLDYTTAHWNPLHNDFFEQNGGTDTMTRVGTLMENAIQGYLIDQKTAQQYQITNLEQLQGEAIATLFDTDGDGKANLIGCPPGWGCRDVVEHHLTAYGLRETVEHDSENYLASINDVFKAYEAGKPVLYYAWTPFWVTSTLVPGQQVEWLEVPYTALPESYPNGTETNVNGKNLGFSVNQVEILASKSFLQKHPVAQSFFEVVQIPIEAVSLQNQKMRAGENTPADIRAHAEEWIADNQQTFDGWIAQAQ